MGAVSGAVNGTSRLGLTAAFTNRQAIGVAIGAAPWGLRRMFGVAQYPANPIPQLFQNGQRGAWYDLSDPSTIFQSTNGAVPVTTPAGQPVALVLDKSGNGNHATQATDAARPVKQTAPDRLVFDKSDDDLIIDFTNDGSFVATFLQASQEGVVAATSRLPNSTFRWTSPGSRGFFPSNNVTELAIAEGSVAPAIITSSKDYFRRKGSAVNFSGVTNFANWFRDRPDLLTLDVAEWDVSAATTFERFIQDTPNLQSIDVSKWDVSNVTNFSRFAQNCSAETLDVSQWNTGKVTAFNNFIGGGANVPGGETLAVDNWDVSQCTTFAEFARTATRLKNLNVSNWNTGNVTDFNNFVNDCTALTALNVSNWNTGNATNFNSFVRNTALQALDVSNWNVGKVTNFTRFIAITNISTLNVTNWNTSSVTTFELFLQQCPNITTLNMSNWNTSKVTNFTQFALNSGLQTLTLDGGTGNPFTDSPCTNYFQAFNGTNLNQATIDNILVRINNAGTSNGTFGQSGGSAPSVATGRPAIDALRARGWTVTVTGGY